MLPVPIQQLPAVHLYELMSYYFMKRHAATLTKAEKRAIAEHVSGSESGSLPDPLAKISQSAYCSAKSDLPVDPLAGATWNGWRANLANERFQSAEVAGLSASEVGDLELTWGFGLPGSTVASLQATVVVGPRGGGGFNVFVADSGARVYAFDLATGEPQWQATVDDHPDARITGAPALHDGRLYVPVASLEEGTAAWPAYQCCTFRGSVVTLDTDTGAQVWRPTPSWRTRSARR